MSISNEITRLQNAKVDLKSAINAKIGTSTLINNESIDEYADFVEGISTGVDINGVIEQYTITHGDNINAGDFVEYLNGLGASKTISSAENSGTVLSAVALSKNKVFIAHNYSTSHYLYGIVCAINGMTIVAETDTQLFSSYAGQHFSIAQLTPATLLISFGPSVLHGVVYAINSFSKITDLSQIISGVAVESGIIGDTIDIYVPNI